MRLELPLAAAAIVFGVIQWGGGAYSAEFDGAADEPSHFLTGLMLRDYALTWPHPSPRPWAEQYYLHYPRVALGQWPPLFHAVEAIWWIVVPPSRATAILLQGIIGWLCLMAFHRLAARSFRPEIAIGASLLLAAAPLFQRGVSQVMTEPLNLLWAILFLDALTGFVASDGSKGRRRLAALIGLSLLVKGTGLALIPAPLLALIAAGRRDRLRSLWKPAIAVAAAVAIVAAWYLAATPSLDLVLRWAGVGEGKWNWKILRVLGGWGVLIAAVARIGIPKRFNAMEASSLALVGSVAGVAFVIRAMDADRHWIAALPAMLLLAASVVEWAGRRPLAGVAAGAAILALFPWQLYRQAPSGIAEVAAGIPRPARVLVSTANPDREGAWVAAFAIGERRPGSVVVRATHGIARESFSGNYYRLITKGEAELDAFLERHAIDTIVVDDSAGAAPARPHHELTRRAALSSGSWTPRATQGKISVFSRIRPPRLAREPLRIELRTRMLDAIVESF